MFMVRRGSTVRVRQRASRKHLQAKVAPKVARAKLADAARARLFYAELRGSFGRSVLSVPLVWWLAEVVSPTPTFAAA
jgi:hypothetical protein